MTTAIADAPTRTLRIGTRASALARTQTATVAESLTASGARLETVLVSTSGDRSAAPLEQIGGTGVFVSALRDALLAGEIDLAVHSFKDLPTQPAPGITVAAVPPRADPRDALCARDGLTLLELPAGAKVGTGSPRRIAQLRALDLGWDLVPIRGNVDTRLGRVGQDLDAVVLAAAGLVRLGRTDAVTELIDPLQVLPAAAQGALAVECRSSDAELVRFLATALDDRTTRAAVAAERSLLTALEAGCTAPVGALAEVVEGDVIDAPSPDVGPGGDGARDGIGGSDAVVEYELEVFLRGSVTAIDGNDAVRLSASGPLATAEEIGRRLAADLIEIGANTMMGSST